VQSLLEQPADALQMCGLSYGLSAHADGFGVTFSGFDQHLAELVKLVLPYVRNPGSDIEVRFEQARRQLILDMMDTTSLQPYQHAMEAFEVVTMKGRFSRRALLSTARDASKINVEAYLSFLQNVMQHARVTVLVTGNIGRERAASLSAVVATGLGLEAKLGSPPNLRSMAAASTNNKSQEEEEEEEGYPTVLKPSQPVEIRALNPIEGDPNSATLVTYQFGVPKIEDRLNLAMLGAFMDRPVFEALRTERQLGYVVFGYVAPHGSIVEVRVLVQGFRESPDIVEGLAEEVLHNLTLQIENMSADELRARRHALRVELEQPPVTLGQVSGQYWGQLWNGEYCFDKKARQLAALEAIENSPEANSPKEMVEAWKQALYGMPDGDSTIVRKVVVKLFGEGAAQSSSPSSSTTSAAKTAITLIDGDAGADGEVKLKDAEYWPHTFFCE